MSNTRTGTVANSTERCSTYCSDIESRGGTARGTSPGFKAEYFVTVGADAFRILREASHGCTVDMDSRAVKGDDSGRMESATGWGKVEKSPANRDN
jgi:hypothetical protein